MNELNIGVSPVRTDTPIHAPNAAMLIDFDNVTMGIRSDLQNQLRALMNSEVVKGKVSVQRAYADWRRYPQYIVPLSEASVDLIFAPAFGSNKKNATDIRLAIDALELVFTRPEIGTFILLSGDSDFSSLVLKLKEYGKYVIGVGIRESSSDLLIQNCDEYYSYNELTGFTKEGEVEPISLDPWELVVQAVTQMKKDNDVMRSDRLKQVMQSLDPTFDEKGAGYNRFSKFVLEAQKRGLVTLAKLENGQFGVDIGDNANVSPEDEAALRSKEPAKSGRAKRRPRSRAPAPRSGLMLAEAFTLLRQALVELDASDDGPASTEAVREKMLERADAKDDPIFDRPRFQRLLRQAHDADMIELIKRDDDYVMKPGPAAAPEGDVAKLADEPSAADKAPRRKSTKKRSTKTTKTTTKTAAKKATRKRTPKASKGTAKRSRPEPEQPTELDHASGAVPERAQAKEPDASPSASPSTAAGSAGKRGLRRRGGRGRSTRPSSASSGGASTSRGTDEPPEPSKPTRSSGARAIGPRRGSSRFKRPDPQDKPTDESPARSPQTEPTPKAPGDDAAAPAARPSPRDDRPVEPTRPSDSDESGGLLKRMSDAIQKVMRGPEDS